MERKNFFEALEQDIMCLHKNTVSFTTQYHYHDGYEIYLFLKGDANYYIEENCYHLKRGCLFNIRPHELHRVERFDFNSYERITLNIRTKLLNDLSTGQTVLTRCFTNRPFGKDNIIYLNEHQINEFVFLANNLEKVQYSKSYGHDLIAQSYLYQILIFVNNLFLKKTHEDPINIMPAIVSNTMLYINEHLTEPITMTDIANYVHHNPTYISRCFKKVTGVPLQQYIIYKRIILAKNYLLEGYSLDDTCRLSGFNDYSNFARTFKKQIGCSPKQYQKQPF
mgnify:CR=1 FL=1